MSTHTSGKVHQVMSPAISREPIYWHKYSNPPTTHLLPYRSVTRILLYIST
jgi:hypothetical protein